MTHSGWEILVSNTISEGMLKYWASDPWAWSTRGRTSNAVSSFGGFQPRRLQIWMEQKFTIHSLSSLSLSAHSPSPSLSLSLTLSPTYLSELHIGRVTKNTTIILLIASIPNQLSIPHTEVIIWFDPGLKDCDGGSVRERERERVIVWDTTLISLLVKCSSAVRTCKLSLFHTQFCISDNTWHMTHDTTFTVNTKERVCTTNNR